VQTASAASRLPSAAQLAKPAVLLTPHAAWLEWLVVQTASAASSRKGLELGYLADSF
jgi:hypothetical protein